MKHTRLKQFAASFLVVLSLLVSSISACACAHHHQEKVETKAAPDCHRHSGMTMAENDSPPAASTTPETVQNAISEGACCCVEPAPKVFSKNENLKIEKQTVALLPKSEIDLKAVSLLVSPPTIDFVTPFYLSDSFYNLAPSRGPPPRL